MNLEKSITHMLVGLLISCTYTNARYYSRPKLRVRQLSVHKLALHALWHILFFQNALNFYLEFPFWWVRLEDNLLRKMNQSPNDKY